MVYESSSSDCSVCGVGCHDLNRFGICAGCYATLSPEDRAAISGKEPPIKEIIHEKQIVTHYPPKPSIIFRIAKLSFFVVQAVATGWLVWCRIGRR